MPESIRRVRTAGAPVFVFHADNPFRPHYASRPESLPAAAACDCYFLWSRSLCERLLATGVRRCEYLPFAWDPDVFPHVKRSPQPEHDLVFIGGWDQGREQLLERLAQHFSLKIWGPDYWGRRTRRESAVRRSWQGRALTEAAASQVIARSRIVLNVLRCQNLPDGTNMRTFEVPGCGGLSLSTRTRGALDLFPEDSAGAYFSSVDECLERAGYLLDNATVRAGLADSAHEIVRTGHEYVHRAQRIVDVFAGVR
jgi:spore maturation protein CgeB